MEGWVFDVFLCYNELDSELVKKIAELLQKSGIQPWLDKWHLIPGDPRQEATEEALEQSASCAVFIGKYHPNTWQNEEMRNAIDVAVKMGNQGYRVIPILLPGAEENSIVPSLRRRVNVDFRAGLDDQQAFSQLLTALPPPRIEAYKKWALTQLDCLDLIGITGTNDFRFDLSEVFIPLNVAIRQLDIASLNYELCRGEDALQRAALDLNLNEVFNTVKDKNLIIFGEPGSGKSTILKWFAYQLLKPQHVLGGLDKYTVPVFLQLRNFSRDNLEKPIANFIQQELNKTAFEKFPEPFGKHLWRRGKLLLLLDGLDEVPDDQLRSEICKYLNREFEGQYYRGIRCIISCRYSGYGGQVYLGNQFLLLDIRPLNTELVREFIRRWFRAAERARNFCIDKEEADQRAMSQSDSLIAGIEDSKQVDQSLKVLISTPLLLTLMCVVVLQRGGEIPWRRTEFYRECLDVLLGTWVKSKGIVPPLDPENAKKILREIAYYMQLYYRQFDLSYDEFSSLSRDIIDKIQRQKTTHFSTKAIFQWLYEGAGVLAKYGPERYGFIHRSFQEYLTAVHIARSGNSFLSNLAERINDQWWQEVILLFLGQPDYPVFDSYFKLVVEKGDIAAHERFIRRCINEADEVTVNPFLSILHDENIDSNQKAVVFRLFLDRDEPELKKIARSIIGDSNEELSSLARQLCTNSGIAVPSFSSEVSRKINQRIKIRSGQSFTELLTGILFLWIPGGQFEMGANDLTPDERPPHTVRVSPFWLGETAVTNRQYAVFLRDSGYDEPKFWRERRLADPDMPVVGVSWYDAKAFCTWLSNTTGIYIHLPSEVQWEFAARGSEGRLYPWGNESPNTTRACYAESGIDTPTIVRSFPKGCGPFGTHEQIGNVWEWCLDVWDDNQNSYIERFKSIKIDPVVTGSSPKRALRGGGWISVPRYLRSAFRGREPADTKFDYIGFRVAAGILKQ